MSLSCRCRCRCRFRFRCCCCLSLLLPFFVCFFLFSSSPYYAASHQKSKTWRGGRHSFSDANFLSAATHKQNSAYNLYRVSGYPTSICTSIFYRSSSIHQWIQHKLCLSLNLSEYREDEASSQAIRFLVLAFVSSCMCTNMQQVDKYTKVFGSAYVRVRKIEKKEMERCG